MITELMESYSKVFYSDDESALSTTTSISPKQTTIDDSLEKFLAENVENYVTVETSNHSSSPKSVDSNNETGVSDKNNDVDIPMDCRNLFTRLMDEIEVNN